MIRAVRVAKRGGAHMTNRQRALIAGAAGIVISAALFVTSYQFGSSILFWPQVFGFYICILTRGFHTATRADFALIALPINAVLYAAAIYLLLKLLAPKRTSVVPKS
jgi:hypothetical protein